MGANPISAVLADVDGRPVTKNKVRERRVHGAALSRREREARAASAWGWGPTRTK